MSLAGRSGYRGLNAQSRAALSLFLQYLSNPAFQKIVLEGAFPQDFVLEFTEGKKIFCESKNYGKALDYSHVKTIINHVIQKQNLNKEDELLIVCSKIKPSIKSEIEYFRFYKKDLVNKFLQKGYSQEAINILPQIKIWEVPSKNTTQIIKFLFTEILDAWMPESFINAKINEVLIEKINDKSENGETLSKDEFTKDLQNLKQEIIQNSSFGAEMKAIETQLAELLESVQARDKKRFHGFELSAITCEPYKMFFVIDRLKRSKSLNLKEWAKLWLACIRGFYSLHLFDIFLNNLGTPENRQYVYEFLKENHPKFAHFYRPSYIESDFSKICLSILKYDPSFAPKLLPLVLTLITTNSKEDFYLKRRTSEDSWHKNELCKVIREMYFTAAAGSPIRNEIVREIYESFNLTQDQGDYFEHTPPDIFSILRADLIEKGDKGIAEFKTNIAKQFTEYYERFGSKMKFDGWEHMAFGISQSGHSYQMNDKNYIEYTLEPALNDLYSKLESTTWKLVTEQLVTRKKEDVSPDRPDFLNRASISVLLKGYAMPERHAEAEAILADFIRMRKGIPHKAELIFQAVVSHPLTDEDKWRLVKISLDEYERRPVNVFVEQIVSDLATKGHAQAIAALQEWVDNPKYLNDRDCLITDNIKKLLGSNDAFPIGCKIFKTYVKTEAFKNKLGNFDCYDTARVLGDILNKNFDLGIEIINEVFQDSPLSTNQQILITSSLNDIKNDSDVVRAYTDFYRNKVIVLLATKKLEDIFPHTYSRESIVTFTEKLMDRECAKEAYELLNILSQDSDPPIIYDKIETDDDGHVIQSEHEQVASAKTPSIITGVRGKCCWAYNQFISIKGRTFIPALVQNVKKLLNEDNFYVRTQACVPLIHLASARHKTMPSEVVERFIPMDTANEIEDMVFQMLENPENQKLKAVMENVTMAASHFYSLPQAKAEKLFDLIFKISEEQKNPKLWEEMADTLIFYVEFRDLNFKDEKSQLIYGEHLPAIQAFNKQPFLNMLDRLIKSNNLEDLLVRKFWNLVKKKTDEDYRENFPIALKYLTLLIEQGYSHHAFEYIYMFIHEHMDEFTNECLQLWEKCVVIEREYLSNNSIADAYWWPNHRNHQILMRIRQERGIDAFLEWLDFLCSYPPNLNIALNLEEPVDALLQIEGNNEKIEKIFQSLISRNTRYFEKYQNWKTKCQQYRNNS